MASNGAVPSRSSARIGVTSSPEIAFPAPAPPLGLGALLTPGSGSSRSKRSAAQAAAASISKNAAASSSSSKVAARDYAQGDGYVSHATSSAVEEDEDEDGAPSLTNGDTMDDDYDDTSSALGQAGMGETDEYTMDEMEFSHDAKYKDELTDEDELLATAAAARTSKKASSKRKASTSSPAKKRAKNAKIVDENIQTDSTEDDAGAATQTASAAKPKRKASARATKAVRAAINGDEEGSDSSALTDIDAKENDLNGPAEEGDEGKPAKKPRKACKPRAPKPEPVYVIPEVEKLPNDQGYKGRLGYACLNTILRKRKPPVFCSRTCRIDTIKKNGMDFLKELGRQNIMDCKQLVQWNEDNVSLQALAPRLVE